MTEYWFKPKDRGYGNVPTTWQGWALTSGFSAFVVAMVVAVQFRALSTFWCVVIVLAVTAGFLAGEGENGWRVALALER